MINKQILNNAIIASGSKIFNSNELNINSQESQEISYKQVQFFENNSHKLYTVYKAKKTIEGNESYLNSNMLLQNYKIELQGNYINIVDKYNNFKYGYFSLGNKKLKSDENTTYLIWNITQKISCKFQCKDCKFCYADKYPNNTQKNIISRSKNMILSTMINFENIFKEVLTIVNKIYGNTIINIRIHESGDIYNSVYARKLYNILNNNKYQNNSLIYTKNHTVLNVFKNRKHFLNIRYSIMDNTSEIFQKIALENNVNFYVATKNKEILNMDNIVLCNMKCTECNKCYSNEYKTIIVPVH